MPTILLFLKAYHANDKLIVSQKQCVCNEVLTLFYKTPEQDRHSVTTIEESTIKVSNNKKKETIIRGKEKYTIQDPVQNATSSSKQKNGS